MAYGTNITIFTNFTNNTLVAAVRYGTNITNFTNIYKFKGGPLHVTCRDQP